MLEWMNLIPDVSLLFSSGDLGTYLSPALYLFMVVIFIFCCGQLIHQFRKFQRFRNAIGSRVNDTA